MFFQGSYFVYTLRMHWVCIIRWQMNEKYGKQITDRGASCISSNFIQFGTFICFDESWRKIVGIHCYVHVMCFNTDSNSQIPNHMRNFDCLCLINFSIQSVGFSLYWNLSTCERSWFFNLVQCEYKCVKWKTKHAGKLKVKCARNYYLFMHWKGNFIFSIYYHYWVCKYYIFYPCICTSDLMSNV